MTPLAVLVDFDGTACPVDVANELLMRFGPAGWADVDAAVERGEITIRAGIDEQAAMLAGSRSELLDYVRTGFAVAPEFGPFCAWADSRGHEVAVVSDGFGFYVRPLLRAAGLSRLPVITNRLVRRRSGWRLLHPGSHPDCAGCGTCKMLAVTGRQRAGARVAFVGNGPSDRFAAFYADIVFAKERLADFCSGAGIDHIPWETFDDVRVALEALGGSVPRKRAPAACPGWAPTGKRRLPAPVKRRSSDARISRPEPTRGQTPARS